MSAEFHQNIRGCMKGIHQIQIVHASAGAFADIRNASVAFVAEGNKNAGAMEPLGNSGRHDTDDSVMPVVIGKHQKGSMIQIDVIVDLPECLVKNCIF